MGSRIENLRRLVPWVAPALALVFIAAIFWLPAIAGPPPSAADRSGMANSANSFVDQRLSKVQEKGHPPADLACRLCHTETEEEITFPSGESLPAAVDVDVLAASAHGSLSGPGLLCPDCHQAADYQIPHEPLQVEDIRHFEVEKAESCERCHLEAHQTGHPNEESDNPVVCTDCHGGHDVRSVEQWEAGEGTDVCVQCHSSLEVSITDPVVLTQIIRDGMFSSTIDSSYCLACHSQPGLTYTFENGDVISLTIDEEAFHNSVHGEGNPWQPLECTDCHGRYTYPHDPVEAGSDREYTLQRYTFCAECHERHYERTMDSVHEAAIEEGNLEAAVCTDCHGAHDVVQPDEPRERISHTCEQCHSSIFNLYQDSVHGEALLTDSNPDVPTCIECHGVHDINDPTTNLARLRSPELCAGCHADENLMAQYDISTEVFDTYVADFHGTTVTLFEHQDPEVETNKAVCYDCHGVHNIKRPDDPDAGIKANLLETCRQCHPDANENFPDAWTSHFKPSLQHNPLVFLVDTFYAIFLPLTLGFFGFLVVTDIYRRVRVRVRKKE